MYDALIDMETLVMAIIPDSFSTKAAAVNHVKKLGYTVHFDTGESGDHGYGSREYFATPDSPKNDWGVPRNQATVSKVGPEWMISTFGE